MSAILFRINSDNNWLIDWDFFINSRKFDRHCFIIAVADATTVSFIRASCNVHDFTNQGVSNNTVLWGDWFTWLAFDELATLNLDISATFDKNTICLEEVLMPEEEVIPVVVADGTEQTFMLAFSHSNHLIDCEWVSFFISCLNHSSRAHLWYFLTDVCCFNQNWFTLLINNFHLIFVYLEYEAEILTRVEVDQIVCFIRLVSN